MTLSLVGYLATVFNRAVLALMSRHSKDLVISLNIMSSFMSHLWIFNRPLEQSLEEEGKQKSLAPKKAAATLAFSCLATHPCDCTTVGKLNM